MLKRDPRKWILSKVNDYTIFSHYFGDFTLYDKTYSSKFRKDSRPSTGFYLNKYGRITYNDFATGEKLSCFDYVAKKFEITQEEAINKISYDFGLKGGNKNPVQIKEWNPTEVEKKECLIQVRPDKWDEKNLSFWQDICITERELIENDVYPVKDLYINSKYIYNREERLRYAYLLKDGDQQYMKIYAPYDENLKWISSIPNNKPFGLHDLPKKSNILIITKSQKDRIIWKKYFTDVIAVQSESKYALLEEDIFWMQDNFEYIYVNFDPDAAGIKAANFYRDEYGFRPMITPEEIYLKGIKDPADFVKQGGLKAFEDFLIYKKLLNGKRGSKN